jgi:hypothetical protein
MTFVVHYAVTRANSKYYIVRFDDNRTYALDNCYDTPEEAVVALIVELRSWITKHKNEVLSS